MIDSVLTITGTHHVVKVILRLGLTCIRLYALKIDLELLDRIVFSHDFDSSFEGSAPLSQLIPPDRFLDQRDVWSEVGIQLNCDFSERADDLFNETLIRIDNVEHLLKLVHYLG